MKPGDKRLTIEVENNLHKDIKARALFRNESVKNWVLRAVIIQIAEEQKAE